MELYAINLTFDKDNNELLSLLPLEEVQKLKKFLKFDDYCRSLVSKIVIRNFIFKKLNIKNNKILFYKNEYGKHFLKNDPDFHFNISHSGSWVVCGIDKTPIGIDIEKIIPIDMGIVNRFFAEEECRDLFNRKQSEKIHYFYDVWTLKESYIKAVGKGLSIPLDSFSINKNINNFILKNESNKKGFYFKQYNIEDDYKLSICVLNDFFTESFIMLDSDDFFWRQ